MPKETITKFKPFHDVIFKFSIARVAEGNFKNLWQLKVQLPDDKELIEEIDADSLSMCLDRVRYIFETEGY